jgi:hypothetical protein
MGLDATRDLAGVYGEENRCPICGAFARVDRDDEFRFVCGVCGSPRIATKAIAVPKESVMALREAAQAKRSAFAWRIAAWGLGLPAALSLALAAVLAPASLLASGVLIGCGVLLAIFAARFSRTATTTRKKLKSSVNEAWEAAALAVLDERGKETTAADLAKALEIPEADAEAMLASLSARSRVNVRVEDKSAELVYESEARPETAAEAEAEAQAAEEEASKDAEKKASS